MNAPDFTPRPAGLLLLLPVNVVVMALGLAVAGELVAGFEIAGAPVDRFLSALLPAAVILILGMPIIFALIPSATSGRPTAVAGHFAATVAPPLLAVFPAVWVGRLAGLPIAVEHFGAGACAGFVAVGIFHLITMPISWSVRLATVRELRRFLSEVVLMAAALVGTVIVCDVRLDGVPPGACLAVLGAFAGLGAVLRCGLAAVDVNPVTCALMALMLSGLGELLSPPVQLGGFWDVVAAAFVIFGARTFAGAAREGLAALRDWVT